MTFTTLNGENAVLVGGRGGWIINHSFVLGGAGYGPGDGCACEGDRFHAR